MLATEDRGAGITCGPDPTGVIDAKVIGFSDGEPTKLGPAPPECEY